MGKGLVVTSADGHAFNVYRAGAEDARFGVVVLQEIFGVNHYIRHMADIFGEAGYAAIAPALFDRVEPNVELDYSEQSLKIGMQLYLQISEESALADIVASAKALNVAKVAIVGYCWGGSLSWLAATRTDVFAAASCWYGGAIVDAKDAVAMCPVQMHFGELDDYIAMASVEAIRAAQPNAEVFVYPGVGHGFGCSERDSFDKTAYDLAQKRTVALFKQCLS